MPMTPLEINTPLNILAMQEVGVPLICPHCKQATDFLDTGEARVGDIVITKELLTNMLNLEDAKCLSIRYDVDIDSLILRVIKTGDRPSIWFQEVPLIKRSEGVDYHRIFLREVL